MIIKKAFAAITNPVLPGGTTPTEGGAQLGKSIAILWRTMIITGGLGFLLFFIKGALEWIMAGGDKDKVQKGRNAVTQGTIGLAFLAGSYVLVKFIGEAVGIDLLSIEWPTAN